MSAGQQARSAAGSASPGGCGSDEGAIAPSVSVVDRSGDTTGEVERRTVVPGGQEAGALPTERERPVVRFRPWRDGFAEGCGFAARSSYVETVWLPVLGPPATLLLRRLAVLLAAQPDGVSVDLRALAADLGIGTGMGRQSPIARTLRRLEHFELARMSERSVVVRMVVPPIPARNVGRLSAGAAAMHRQLLLQHHARQA